MIISGAYVHTSQLQDRQETHRTKDGYDGYAKEKKEMKFHCTIFKFLTLKLLLHRVATTTKGG